MEPSKAPLNSDMAPGEGDAPCTGDYSFPARSRLPWLIGGGIGLAAFGAGAAILYYRDAGTDVVANSADPSLTPPRKEPPHDPLLAERVAELRELKSQIVDALGSGKTIEPALINKCTLGWDWLEFAKSHADSRMQTIQGAIDQYYSPASKEVGNALQREHSGLSGTSSTNALMITTDPIPRVKRAFESCFKTAKYNSDRNLMFDALARQGGPESRFQCESASRLFMCLLRDHVKLNENARFVYVYLPGHVLPGVMTDSGTLIGFEMICRGSGIVDFSAELKSPHLPFKVTDANLDDLKVLAEDIPELSEDKIILFDSSNLYTPSQRRGSKVPPSRSHFAFGTCTVPQGDLLLSEQSEINPATYGESQGVYSTLQAPAQPQAGNSAREASGRRVQTYQVEEILGKLKPRDRPVVASFYARCNELRVKYDPYEAQRLAIEGDVTFSHMDKAYKLRDLADKLELELEHDGIFELRKKAQKTVSEYGLEMIWNDSTPYGTYLLAVNNCNYQYQQGLKNGEKKRD